MARVNIRQQVVVSQLSTRKGAELVYGYLICCARCGKPGGTLVKAGSSYVHQGLCGQVAS